VLTLNIPGPVKRTPLYDEIHKEGIKCLFEAIGSGNIVFAKVIYNDTGAEGYICADIDAVELKKIAVKIEAVHPLGRIFDIDVYDRDHSCVSREMLELSERKCFLCEKPAKECARSRRHSLEEIIEYINATAESYFNLKKAE